MLVERGLQLAAVAETHAHNDYVTGGLELARKADVPYLVPCEADAAYERTEVCDEDVRRIGQMTVRTIGTPGHTPHHVTFAVGAGDEPSLAFTGGSMLFGSVGRTDLVSPDLTVELSHRQYASVRRLVDELPGSAAVLPTHGFGSFCSATPTSGDASTIDQQREQNPALSQDEEQFVRTLLEGFDAYPAYYAHMGPTNLAGPAPVDLSPVDEADGEELRRRIAAGEWVVDLRERTAFARGHVPGSYSFDASGNMVTFLGWLIPWGTPLTLIGDSPKQVADAQRELARIGIDRPAAQATAPVEELADGQGLASFPTATFEDLAAVREQDPDAVVVDVRRDGEWQDGHIDGALAHPAARAAAPHRRGPGRSAGVRPLRRWLPRDDRLVHPLRGRQGRHRRDRCVRRGRGSRAPGRLGVTVDGPGRRSAAPAAAPAQVRLGLRENAGQFGLLVVVNAFVGAAIGVERTAVPLLAERAFGLTGATVVASFVLAFGLAKALTNLAAGGLSTRLGRRRLLLLGWVIAIPVPLLLLGAQSWSWVIAANVLLGISQGVTWSTTVVMKIDLVGPQRRGLALGLNEAAGYGAVAAAAYVAGVLAAEHGPRTAPFLLLAGLVAAGLLLSLGVRDTAEHVALEQAAHPLQEAMPLRAALRAGTWGDRQLSAVSAAGLANNLNDAYAWALLPLLLLSRGLTATQTAAVAAVYPAVWGIGQLGTGALSDRVGRRPLLSAGFALQTLSLLALLPDAGFHGSGGRRYRARSRHSARLPDVAGSDHRPRRTRRPTRRARCLPPVARPRLRRRSAHRRPGQRPARRPAGDRRRRRPHRRRRVAPAHGAAAPAAGLTPDLEGKTQPHVIVEQATARGRGQEGSCSSRTTR